MRLQDLIQRRSVSYRRRLAGREESHAMAVDSGIGRQLAPEDDRHCIWIAISRLNKPQE